MNKPIVICEDSFQLVWAKAINELNANHWKAWNIIAQINVPKLFDSDNNKLLEAFAKKNTLISPKHVAHTIFPKTFFKDDISRTRFYEKYWKFFKWSRKRAHSGWGTYFERMIRYSTSNGNIDQLGSIIDNIKNRSRNYGAAHTIIIPYPHRDLNKLMGSPCLNYITVQVEESATSERTINLLAVYRNHDFTERAYGNYLGLCDLLKYISCETNSLIGTLTCISSHAYVLKGKSELLKIAGTILGGTN